MTATHLALVLQETGTRATQPDFFVPVFLSLFVLGALGWLIAAVVGFGRARSFGTSARWFALSAVCLLIYHLHLLLIGIIGAVEIKRGSQDYGSMLSVGAFFNLFLVLGAVCAIIGFLKLKSPSFETGDTTPVPPVPTTD
jgi:hypothetical protein